MPISTDVNKLQVFRVPFSVVGRWKKMLDSRYNGLVLGFIVLVALVGPAAAFGAGNIGSTSKVEGQNCTPNPPPTILLHLSNARLCYQQGDTVTSKMPYSHWPWLRP